MISSPALIAKRLQRQLAEPCRPGVRPRALLRLRAARTKRSRGPSLLKAWAATAGQWLQARAHGRARPASSFLSRGPSACCTCVQVTWHRSLRWFSVKPPPAELADAETPKPAPAAVAPPLSAGDIRRDRADALYVYQKDGAWRLQSWSKSSIWTFRLFPTSRRGAGSCFSLGLRPATSLSRRRRAARLSPLRRRPQPSRPSHLPLSSAPQAG